MNDQQTQNCQNAAELIVPAEAVTAEFATKPIGIAEVCDRLEHAIMGQMIIYYGY